jgi:hypothetical protein
MTIDAPGQTTPEAVAIDLLCAMRPDVRREVFEDFMAGRSPQTRYLHVDPKEFLLIAALAAQRAAEAVEQMRVRKDAAYTERNRVVAALAKLFPSGTKQTDIPGWSEDWHGCVYIDLPTGQVSWHYHDSQAPLFADLPPYRGEWDGHTTELKYERLAALAAIPPSGDAGEPVFRCHECGARHVGGGQSAACPTCGARHSMSQEIYAPDLIGAAPSGDAGERAREIEIVFKGKITSNVDFEATYDNIAAAIQSYGTAAAAEARRETLKEAITLAYRVVDEDPDPESLTLTSERNVRCIWARACQRAMTRLRATLETQS